MAKKSTQKATKKQQKLAKNKVLRSHVNNDSEKIKMKRINYSQENVEKALKTMRDTGLSLRKAAAAYGIPVATLSRKKNINPEKIKRKTGPETVLSIKEEDDIVKWVLDRAKIGAPVTKTELLDSVQKYVQSMAKKTPFTDDRPSRHWYEGFKKRHPELSIVKPQHLSSSRATVGREELQDWIQNSEKYLKDKDLLNIPPNRIFSCNESSIPLCPDAESMLTAKRTRAVLKVVDVGKEALTVLFMYKADGTRAPPMLMYSYKKGVPPRKVIDNTPSEWGIGISNSGRITTETFYEYITNVFYPWLVKVNTEFPIVIYIDNHPSHLSLPLVTFCHDKKIELIMLPPNSTHIMQPLNITFFHPFNETWEKCVPKWKNQQNIKQIKKEDFPLVLQFTLENMTNEEKVVVSGFKKSGLYPFNPKAVDYDILNQNNESRQTTDDQPDTTMNNDSNCIQLKQFLEIFEKNLTEETLSDFKKAAISGLWTGDIEKKALFDYWFEVHKKSMGI